MRRLLVAVLSFLLATPVQAFPEAWTITDGDFATLLHACAEELFCTNLSQKSSVLYHHQLSYQRQSNNLEPMLTTLYEIVAQEFGLCMR